MHSPKTARVTLIGLAVLGSVNAVLSAQIADLLKRALGRYQYIGVISYCIGVILVIVISMRERAHETLSKDSEVHIVTSRSHYYASPWDLLNHRLDLVRHPLRFALAIARDPTRYFRHAIWLLIPAGFAAIVRATIPNGRAILRELLFFVGATVAGAALFAIAWVTVRSKASFLAFFCLALYFNVLGNTFFILTVALTERVLNTGGIETVYHPLDHLPAILDALSDCIENRGFATCVDSTQPMMLRSYEDPRAVAVYRDPHSWYALGVLTISGVCLILWTFVLWRSAKWIGRATVLRTILAFLVSPPLSWLFATASFIARAPRQGCDIAVPMRAALNPGPLRFGVDAFCSEFPLIDVHKQSSSAPRELRFADSLAEHLAGMNANIGDTLHVRIWIDNGADDLTPELDTAKGVRVVVRPYKASVGEFRLSAFATSTTAPTINSVNPKYGGDFTVRTPKSAVIEYVPDSTVLCISKDHSASAFHSWEAGQGSSSSALDFSSLCAYTQKGVKGPDGIMSSGLLKAE